MRRNCSFTAFRGGLGGMVFGSHRGVHDKFAGKMIRDFLFILTDCEMTAETMDEWFIEKNINK